MQPDWRDLSYLQRGTGRQKQAYRAIRSSRVHKILRDFSPTLAGTCPIDVDGADSDLDIICHAPDLDAFERRVTTALGAQKNLRIKRKTIRGIFSVIAEFQHAGFTFQLFAQPIPVHAQYAYRHLLVEARVLEIGGDAARKKIRALKERGLKTEPAFAQLLHLVGDPYEALLEVECWTDAQLKERIATVH